MKKVSLIFLVFGLAMCADPDQDEVIEPPKKVLKDIVLSADRTDLLANGEEKATFKLEFRDQFGSPIDVDATKVEYLVNDVAQKGNSVQSEKDQTLSVVAKVDDVKSNLLQITCILFDLKIDPVYDFFYANGASTINFSTKVSTPGFATTDLARVNPKLIVNNAIQPTMLYSTGTAGTYNIRLVSGKIESNSLQITARPDVQHIEPIQIPVIFHLFHDKEWPLGDINNPKYEDMMEAFNRLNAIFAADPKVEKIDYSSATASKTSIQFILADKSPDGKILDEKGVVRYPQSKGYFTQPEANALALENIWDTEKFINIFLIHGDYWGSGFATLPFTSTVNSLPGLMQAPDDYKAKYDMVMLRPNVLYMNPFMKYRAGQTLAHEIGHHLGLYHVFSDDGCPTPDFDYCSDTYLYDRAAYMKAPMTNVTTRNTCEGRQVTASNVMDYFFHGAVLNDVQKIESSVFTQDQVKRMYHVLQNSPVRRHLGRNTLAAGRSGTRPYTTIWEGVKTMP